jgi:hypothetical protein
VTAIGLSNVKVGALFGDDSCVAKLDHGQIARFRRQGNNVPLQLPHAANRTLISPASNHLSPSRILLVSCSVVLRAQRLRPRCSCSPFSSLLSLSTSVQLLKSLQLVLFAASQVRSTTSPPVYPNHRLELRRQSPDFVAQLVTSSFWNLGSPLVFSLLETVFQEHLLHHVFRELHQ